MDAAWSSLSVETHSALCDALSRTIGSMTNQVTMHILIMIFPAGLFCTVLYCTVLYCTVLYCTVLYCYVPCSSLPFASMNAIDCNMVWYDLLLLSIICIDEQSKALLISSHPFYRKKSNMMSLFVPIISHVVIIYFLFFIYVLMSP